MPMTDEADRHQKAGLETAKLHLINENESVVRHAMEQHEILVASWLQDWRSSLFPSEANGSVDKRAKRSKRA